MQKVLRRVKFAIFTVPSLQDWLYTIALLLVFGLVYLPIGFKLGFLEVVIQPSWQTIFGVVTGAFFMPALFEELSFRVLILSHPSETVSFKRQSIQILLSWMLFMVYHVHPFVPIFFKTPAFLIATGLIGIACTMSYLQSGSLWTPLVTHWSIVIVWLLALGGLEEFKA